MLFKLKNIILNLTFFSFAILYSYENNTFYNYPILISSPNSIEFDHTLKADYESNLIHELDRINQYPESELEYEKKLNLYYKQYKKENEKFINAIVEPDVFYISSSIGASNIIVGKNNYSFGKNIGFHIDSPYAFKIFKKIVVIGLKSSVISLPPSNSSNWDNYRSINMSSTYSMKLGNQFYALSGLGITLNSSNVKDSILPLLSFDLAYELPWKPLNIPFDITFCGSGGWDLKNIYIGLNIMLCKPYKIILGE